MTIWLKKNIHILLFCLALCCGLIKVYAQPANDNCANASVVNISNSGFGLGIFTSKQYDMTAAILQAGKTFFFIALTANMSVAVTKNIFKSINS